MGCLAPARFTHTDSATSTSPSCCLLAKWCMRHKSLITKILVSCSFLLRHVATGSASPQPIPCAARTGAQRADEFVVLRFLVSASWVGQRRTVRPESMNSCSSSGPIRGSSRSASGVRIRELTRREAAGSGFGMMARCRTPSIPRSRLSAASGGRPGGRPEALPAVRGHPRLRPVRTRLEPGLPGPNGERPHLAAVGPVSERPATAVAYGMGEKPRTTEIAQSAAG